jgi:hypothetical protein
MLEDNDEGRGRGALWKAPGPLGCGDAEGNFVCGGYKLVRRNGLRGWRRSKELLKQAQGKGIGISGFAQRLVLIGELVSVQDRFYKSERWKA